MTQKRYELSGLIEAVSEMSGGRLSMTLIGDSVEVVKFAPPQEAGEGDMAFLTDAKYAQALKDSKASVVVLRQGDCEKIFGENPGRRVLVCDNPYAFFAFVSQILFPIERTPGIHEKAYVEEGAEVDPSASVLAFAVVKKGAKIGRGALISEGAYIGRDVEVGDGVVVYPNAVVQHGCVLGSGTIIQPGAVVGGDGFGFAPFKGEWVKIPQVGRVVLGSNVEIGANTTVDRGALEDTIVGEGTKLDNQIQIAHNDKIGRHCVMASCVGIAGSTTVGDHVMIGGAAMINGHISIPSGSAVGPATVITGWGSEPCQKTGFFPAQEGRQFQLTAAATARLPELRREIKELKREIEELKRVIRSQGE